MHTSVAHSVCLVLYILFKHTQTDGAVFARSNGARGARICRTIAGTEKENVSCTLSTEDFALQFCLFTGDANLFPKLTIGLFLASPSRKCL